MLIEYIKLDRLAKDYAVKRAAAEAALKAALPNNELGEAISDDGTTSWCKTIAGHGIVVAAEYKAIVDSELADKTTARQKVIADVVLWEARKELNNDNPKQ